MRRLGSLALALVAALTALGTPIGPTAPALVRAAAPDLTVVSAARYDVQPDQRRVRVTVDLTMRNRLKDTKTKRFFFEHAEFDVIPQASGFRVSTKGAGSPSVRVTRSTADYTRLRIDFGGRLFSGKSATYRLTFFLEDPGGAATRELRIGDALVSFPVWAFGTEDTPGSSVMVVFPSGYEVVAEAGEVPAPETLDDGRVVYRTGPLAKPLEFFLYLVGSRPGAFDERLIQAEVRGRQVQVTLRSWSDDAPWAKRVAQLLAHSLPLLGERIGVPWPDGASPLVVQEAVSRSAGGYAGRFDPAAGLVEIAYYADDFVVFHEAAHAWFNGSLLADRWANEAFASYYATRVAADLDHPVDVEELTDEMLAARIPLNGWGPVGSEDQAQEAYAYAASLTLARAIATRAGDVGLQAVWSDAAGGVGAYQPRGGQTETVEGPPDWRGLLDLLEARTDATYDDLWREWVARPTDLILLDSRAAARTRYEAIVSEARDWRLPQPIRDAMRAWRFDDATAMLDDAEAVLVARAELTAAAKSAGLVAPDALRLAFEDPDGFDDATAEAAAEREVIERYVAATGLRPIGDGPILTLGLWGTTPETDLAAARNAFARGELEVAAAATEDAAAVWASAERIGQSRAISIALLALAVLIGLAILVAATRRRRRRRVRMHATRVRG
jgi:hypothetical protein